MGFDSPVIFPLFTPKPARQVFSGSCAGPSNVPFTMPTAGNVRRLTINTTGGGPSLIQAGWNPTVAVNGFVYVCNFTANSISVISQVTNTVVATIALAVGANPWAAALSPNGRTLYVANSGNATVSVIDTVTNTVTGAPIAVGVGPRGIVVTSDGLYVYVANTTAGTVSVISVATLLVIATVAVGASPRAIVAKPDATQVYVGNNTDGTVSVISVATNTVIAVITALATVPTMAVSPDGGSLYVYNTNGGIVNIAVVNLTNFIVTSRVNLGGSATNTQNGLVVSPDGLKIYVSCLTDNKIFAISAVSLTVITTRALTLASSLAISPDGLFLYVTNNAAAVSVLNTTTWAQVGGAIVVPGGNNLTMTPLSAAITLGQLVINAHIAVNTVVANEIPLTLAAGAQLGILNDTVGIVLWTIEIE